MKCQKCGAEIPENKIYCEKCGLAIQMVPDYDPGDDVRIGEEKTPADRLPADPVPVSSKRKKYIIAGIFAAVICVLIYQGAYRTVLNPSRETGSQEVLFLEKPSLSLPSGTYSYTPSLTISHPQRTEGVIYYTTDGTTPDENSQVFRSPIMIGEGKTVVRAVFIRSDGRISEEADGAYQVEFEYPEEPEFSVEGGEYQEEFYVTISAEPDCTVYYTLDGSVPDRRSSIYVAPIHIRYGLTVLSAVAVDEEGGASAVMEAIYNVYEDAPFDHTTFDGAAGGEADSPAGIS